MTTLNLDYARKAEGIYYGDGAADVARAVALAAAKYKTAKGRATAAYKALCEAARNGWLNPEIECVLRGPGEGWHGNCWYVGWESGPYQWAIVASEALCQLGVFAEPHYSFDLCFYEGDD